MENKKAMPQITRIAVTVIVTVMILALLYFGGSWLVTTALQMHGIQ